MDDVRLACDGVRELMLEAEPAGLRGAGDSQVAVHVRACSDCRALATRMLDAQQELAGALAALASQHVSHASPEQTVRASGVRRRLGRHAIGAFAPLAAAAVLVLIFHQQRSGDELPPLEPLPDAIALAADRPVVNVTSGDDVAIMSTTNPNITVVWYLKRER